MTRIDLVVAVRDEEESLPLFVDEVRGLQLPEGTQLRMVFVEDSSRDRTRDILHRLATRHADIAYYSVSNDYGQGPAIVFGLSRCRGDAVITMDVDGTHPVSAIPVLVERFVRGDDIVQCVRRTPQDREWYRNAGASAFHLLARLLTGVDTRQQNFYFRLMSAAAVRELLKHPRYWRHLRLPLRNRPRVSFLFVDAVDRRVGGSKYHFMRLARLAIDGVLSLLSGGRLLFASVLVAGCVAALWVLGFGWLGVALGALHVGFVVRYFVLHRFNLLNHISIVESVDDPLQGGARRAG